MLRSEYYDYMFKIILIGDSGTGKSSLFKRYSDCILTYENKPTIGVDFFSKLVIINNKKIKIQIWDSAGQEKFRSLTQSYYRGATGSIFVYDITNKQTFDNIISWIQETHDYIPMTEKMPLEAILVGNKYDICNDNDLCNNRQVTYEEGRSIASKYGMEFMEVSAYTNYQVTETFDLLIINILRSIGQWNPDILEESSTDSSEKEHRSKCNCYT